MTSMLEFQHAYDAAARFLTAVDQTLDTLIHQTGLVGR
jgi:flagellar hook-associated protein 1 FlgK